MARRGGVNNVSGQTNYFGGVNLMQDKKSILLNQQSSTKLTGAAGTDGIIGGVGVDNLSGVQSVTGSGSIDSSTTTAFQLLSVSGGEPLIVGEKYTVHWKSSKSDSNELISFSMASVNAQRGDGGIILGKTNLSQDGFAFSVPNNTISGNYFISANNESGSMYSNSPTFTIKNTVTIDSVKTTPTQAYQTSRSIQAITPSIGIFGTISNYAGNAFSSVSNYFGFSSASKTQSLSGRGLCGDDPICIKTCISQGKTIDDTNGSCVSSTLPKSEVKGLPNGSSCSGSMQCQSFFCGDSGYGNLECQSLPSSNQSGSTQNYSDYSAGTQSSAPAQDTSGYAPYYNQGTPASYPTQDASSYTQYDYSAGTQSSSPAQNSSYDTSYGSYGGGQTQTQNAWDYTSY